MSAIHELQIESKSFNDIHRGNNHFEIMKSSHVLAAGDMLNFNELDENAKPTGRVLTRRVSYVITEPKDELPIKNGCILIGLTSNSGIDLIRAERQRQIILEGYDANNDDSLVDPTDKRNWELPLVEAAIAYADQVAMQAHPHDAGAAVHERWPWHASFWKPSTPIRMLVKAGALIAAEIDRRLRAGEEP
jgi:hypothetical protein